MKLAILIPCFRELLTTDERISLKHFNHHLSHFDIIVIKPENLRLTGNTCSTINFPDRYFTGIPAYSRLLLERRFYEQFQSYDYILIYQLDALVFSSDITAFCQLGYDYIGAPLFQRYSQKPVLSRVGNGGLSLRQVGAFLDVLNSPRYTQEPVSILKEFFTARIPDLDEWPTAQRWRKKLQILLAVRKGVDTYTRQYSLNEDLFWSDRARLFDPTFKIAPVKTALQFSFDRHPRHCFELNNRQLPFGCHAWAKWDRAFWEPYLLK